MEGIEILNEVSQETLLVLGILTAVIAVILFILMFYTPYWIYKDANKRNMLGLGWSLLVLFFLFFGIIPGLIFLIIYLFIRNPIGGKDDEGNKDIHGPVFGERKIDEGPTDNNTTQNEPIPDEDNEEVDTEWEDLEGDDEVWEDF